MAPERNRYAKRRHGSRVGLALGGSLGHSIRLIGRADRQARAALEFGQTIARRAPSSRKRFDRPIASVSRATPGAASTGSDRGLAVDRSQEFGRFTASTAAPAIRASNPR